MPPDVGSPTVAPEEMPSNLLFSASVKLFSLKKPSPTPKFPVW